MRRICLYCVVLPPRLLIRLRIMVLVVTRPMFRVVRMRALNVVNLLLLRVYLALVNLCRRICLLALILLSLVTLRLVVLIRFVRMISSLFRHAVIRLVLLLKVLIRRLRLL